MTTPYLGQINLFPFNFAPKGWALCAGQLLSIPQNQALFALLGVQFGGDGQSTFALPNLQAAAAVGAGAGFTVGQTAGEVAHTLVVGEFPSHTHTLNADASTAASSNGTVPASNVVLGQSAGTSTGTPPTFTMNMYNSAGPTNTLNDAAVGTTGGQPHPNMMPYLGVNFCIALNGVFPPRN